MPPTASGPQVSESGVVEARYWDNVGGSAVDNLMSLAAYPDNPDEVRRLNELRGPQNRADNYGSLVRGFIIPPADGTYRFFVTGDGETQFWFSTGRDPENAQMTALMPRSAAPGDYSRYNSQASRTIELTANTRHYFEIRHKERSGRDHFNVAWEGPGFSRRVIGGDSIASLGQSPYGQSGLTGREGVEAAYSLGYRIGFFDRTRGSAFDSRYPPLDQDQDGIYDNWETFHGLDPSDRTDATTDTDKDVLNAQDEFWLGSSPANPDSDGDGIPDGVEFANALNPLNPEDAQEDLDGDGTSNLEEYREDTDMADAGAYPGVTESATAEAREVMLSWTAPGTRMDGSSIALSEIQSYEVLFGQDPDQLDQTVTVDGSETDTTISGLEPGTWYFAVRVIDDKGLASPSSDPVEYNVD